MIGASVRHCIVHQPIICMVYSEHNGPTYSIFLFPSIQVAHKPSSDLGSGKKTALRAFPPQTLGQNDNFTIQIKLAKDLIIGLVEMVTKIRNFLYIWH